MKNDFKSMVLGNGGRTTGIKCKKSCGKKAKTSKKDVFSFGKSRKSEKAGNAWLNKVAKQAKW